MSDAATVSPAASPQSVDGDNVPVNIAASVEGDNGLVAEASAKAGNPSSQKNSHENITSEGKNQRASGKSSAVSKKAEQSKAKVADVQVTLVMQALHGLKTPQEKLAALCKKYAELLDQQKEKDSKIKLSGKQINFLTREKERLQRELNTAILQKSKLENLARELDKQKKLLKEESYNLSVSHNKEREQVSAKFQAATDEISSKINAIAERNEELNSKNRDMSKKIEELLEESSARESVMKKIIKQRDLKEQILELKVKKAEDERDIALEDVKTLKSDLKKSAKLFANQEKELKSQITFYSEKVAAFQSTLDQSNQVFSTFRSEMDGMGKTVKTLEKTTESWKKCYEKSNAENQKLKSDLEAKQEVINKLTTKSQKLSDLCRALQAERHALAAKSSNKAEADTTNSLFTEEEVEIVVEHLSSSSIQQVNDEVVNKSDAPVVSVSESQDVKNDESASNVITSSTETVSETLPTQSPADEVENVHTTSSNDVSQENPTSEDVNAQDRLVNASTPDDVRQEDLTTESLPSAEKEASSEQPVDAV